MAQEITLGGERLGSGKKMQQEMHNYGMNSFNQNRSWWSTMAPGILYPCFKEIGTTHGTFDIDIDTFVRTLPTKGPLFGSFKMQIDLFNVPFRLYQGVLHNNPVDIGMHMNQVKLPRLCYYTIDGKEAPRVEGSTEDDCQVSTSSLIKYMGISGAGHHELYNDTTEQIQRQFQCVPELGYYDIFKNYYANKQETNAYVITPKNVAQNSIIPNAVTYAAPNINGIIQPYYGSEININYEFDNSNKQLEIAIYYRVDFPGANEFQLTDTIKQKILEEQSISFKYVDEGIQHISIYDIISGGTIYQHWELNNNPDETKTIGITIRFAPNLQLENNNIKTIQIDRNNINFEYYAEEINLQPFNLKNIDKMRAKLLSNCELGEYVKIDITRDSQNVWGSNSGEDQTGYPYYALVKTTSEGISWNAFAMNGLVTKTYQSDMFNNWLDNTMVAEIARRTKIDTTSGGFTPDTLILQEKIYNYLNRILISGGTYYDWQEATYGEGVARMCEIPLYIGGMSAEIVFEEVIANNESKIDERYQALGSLAGKGKTANHKGGKNIHVRMDEPGYIIGICSITPRISQYQGNDWDRTEILTMDDLHKPELDGIGFQDLMLENMAWWNTKISSDEPDTVINRDSVGKQTAWLHYQTAVDKVYGDFAKSNGYSFMVLTRQYEHDEENVNNVPDVTTYIDPTKYNYAFAYQDLAAQNFWVQIAFKCTSRRKMGAQQLPQL